MNKYFFFLDYLKQYSTFFRSQIIKAGRLMKILFKKRKKLEIITLEYYRMWHFDNAYLLIDFKFNNAVWFSIEKHKCYDLSKQIALNLKNIQTETATLEVFGFFQKLVYKIHLNKETSINTQSFRPYFERIHVFESIIHESINIIPKLGLHIANPSFVSNKIVMRSNNISINHKLINIQDYI